MEIKNIVCFSIIITFEMSFNTIAISLIFRKRSKTTLKDKLVTTLCFINISQTIPYSNELIFAILDSAEKRVCIAAAFLVCFATYTSIGYFVVLLIERYISVVFPFKYDVITHKKWVRNIFFMLPVLYGLMFSVPPLLGWGKYGHTQRNATYCGYDIKMTRPTDKSFFYTAIILTFGMPVIFTSLCFGHIYINLRRTALTCSRRFGHTSTITLSSWRTVKEQYISSLLTTLFYFVSWVPYTAVCFLHFYQFKVPQEFEDFAVYMSKSSTITSPVVYCLIEKRVWTSMKRNKRLDVELNTIVNRANCDVDIAHCHETGII